MQTVAVLDYGMSNLRSVAKALEFVSERGCRITVTDRAEDLVAADRIVFPGQGAIGQCMENLARLDLGRALAESVRRKPYLGICLGLQSLMEHSAEDGGVAGLGLVPGTVARFPSNTGDADGARYKIPHMGWNGVVQRKSHPLWRGIESGERFYFVHSYFVVPARGEDIAATTDYALTFTSAVARDNVFAVQFHPEKSQRAGLQLLRNFLSWRP